ncbi:MAG: ECF-type sigma factor [Pirellulaceae bacterium]|jgi:RNA polymerase sigma-70 factor (ECF subfamily)
MVDGWDQELYQQLRSVARRFMGRESANHTLTPTDLFHEAFARVQPRLLSPAIGVHDIRALMAATMRRVLIDHARKKLRRHRKLPRAATSVDQCSDPLLDQGDRLSFDLLTLDEALRRLADQHPTHAQLVELKFFGNMTIPQCSQQLGISEATVERHWAFSRAWLLRELSRQS